MSKGKRSVERAQKTGDCSHCGDTMCVTKSKSASATNTKMHKQLLGLASWNGKICGMSDSQKLVQSAWDLTPGVHSNFQQFLVITFPIFLNQLCGASSSVSHKLATHQECLVQLQRSNTMLGTLLICSHPSPPIFTIVGESNPCLCSNAGCQERQDN